MTAWGTSQSIFSVIMTWHAVCTHPESEDERITKMRIKRTRLQQVAKTFSLLGAEEVGVKGAFIFGQSPSRDIELVMQPIHMSTSSETAFVQLKDLKKQTDKVVDTDSVELLTVPYESLVPDDAELDHTFDIDTRRLRTAINYVYLVYADVDSGREHMKALRIKNEVLEATDGHRCHRANLKAPADFTTILPQKVVDILYRLLNLHDYCSGVARFTQTGPTNEIKTPDFNLVWLEPDFKFPPTEKVWPSRDPRFGVSVHTQSLLDLSELLNGLPMSLTISDKSEVVRAASQLKESNLTVESRLDAMPYEKLHNIKTTISFNSNYVYEAIFEGFDTYVHICSPSGKRLDGWIIGYPGAFEALVMPMNVH